MYACVCMCLYVPTMDLRSQKMLYNSPGIGVTGSDEHHIWVPGSEPQPLEHVALLSTEPYLLSPKGNNFEIGKRHFKLMLDKKYKHGLS